MAASTHHLEHELITCYPYSESTDSSSHPEIIQDFLSGKYESVLSSRVGVQVLSSENDQTNSNSNSKDLSSFIQANVKSLISESGECQDAQNLSVLTVAASCLQLFVQNNWTGPPTQRAPVEFLHKCFQSQIKEVTVEAQNDMSMDGETVYSKCRHLIYLYISRILLLECRQLFTDIQTWDWWLLRCLLTQQALLSDRSPTLMATVLELIDKLSKQEPLMTDEKLREVQTLFHVEAGHACHTYLEYKKAEEHFNTGRKIAGIQVELGGAMGKRTQFQEEDKAQLVLRVTKDEDRLSRDAQHAERNAGNAAQVATQQTKPSVPKNLPLDDDTVLNEIKFSDVTVQDNPDISQVDQTVVMGLMESLRRSMARDRLTDEEVLTYIDFILRYVTNWGVSATALMMRSKLEEKNRRRVERSMMQFDDLAKLATTETEPHVRHRTPLFYASRMSPFWQIQKELAVLLLSLGLTGEALDVFEKLDMWEDVIACYQRMNKTEKAESVIRQQLAIKETPTLLCYLGDVTRDRTHYQRAWEMSNHRSARAQRCLGYIYFHERDYQRAMESFAISLKLNSLQIPVWFTYGCAAMTCQEYSVGVTAFRRCVSIDYDNFEAWSNLSTCYCRLKDKQKAYAVLQDALKCCYDNWMLWENNLIIGIDVGQFTEVIRSYHRLIDLKSKWTDNQVLSILTRAVLEDIPDANGNPSSRHMDKLLELFGRITAAVTSEGDIWMNYAKLSSSNVAGHQPDMDKSLQFLQKAYRCYTQTFNWEKDVDKCKQIAEKAVHLARAHMECADGKPQQESVKLLSAAKLMLRGALVKIQKQHTDPISSTLAAEVTDICQLMEQVLTEILTQIDTLRNS